MIQADEWKAMQADIHLSEDEVDRCRQQAKEVTWRLLGKMLRTSKRRTPPPWSLPVEVWVIMMVPRWQRERTPDGIGYDRHVQNRNVLAAVEDMVARVLAARRIPKRANASWGILIDKTRMHKSMSSEFRFAQLRPCTGCRL